MNLRIVLTAFLVPACISSTADSDIEDDDSVSGGKSDSFVEGSTAAAAILSLVNDPRITVEQLDEDAGLSLRVAEGIIALRDSQTIDDLVELDSVPNVGALTFQQLAKFAPTVIPERDFSWAGTVLDTDATWSPSSGRRIKPPEILYVQNYVTLTITAGTQVVMERSSIVVRGTLVIKGVRSAPVAIFGEEGASWSGIQIEDHGRVVIEHASIADAQIALTANTGSEEVTARNLTLDNFSSQGVRVTPEATVSIDGLIAKNSPRGWALRVDEGGTANVRNALITDTDLAVYNEGTTIIDGATLVGSTANCSAAAGSQTTIRNSIIVGGALPEGSPKLERVLLWQTAAGSLPAGASVLRGDPEFVSATDFHLTANSPAVNAGVGESTHDLSGRPRVNAPDLGAYELVN